MMLVVMRHVVSRLLIVLILQFAMSVTSDQQHRCVNDVLLNDDTDEWSAQVPPDGTLLVQWSLHHVSSLRLSVLCCAVVIVHLKI